MQTLTVDLFVSVDGWASGTTSPGYFGYFGPELEAWVTTELALPQLVLLGRRTYDALVGLAEQARDASFHRTNPVEQGRFLGNVEDGVVAEHAHLS